ncbi:uncharacterized protein METZ01_LOCUS290151 [marine metagenome]|uniref:Uncharacterized protein n=1 Tax=marine metagenome TaxID=408172 RepID=A0A382LPW7_9ZZZZ
MAPAAARGDRDHHGNQEAGRGESLHAATLRPVPSDLVSTRLLILSALGCGLAVLLAYAVQVLVAG